MAGINGQIPIPFSIYPNNIGTTQAVTELDEKRCGDCGIDKINRLIKGQVFLWESAKDGRFMDLDGQIASL
jgi:hypothetical protein